MIMAEFLLFTLAAPLAAMGEIAVGERRMGWARPSRSQVLGLVAGALGVTRDQESAHQGLEANLGFAVRTDALGRPLFDYHTAQVPDETARKARHKAGLLLATRADELACDGLETILSRREYRTDSLFTVALWARCREGRSLSEITAALDRPQFIPYFGRKSCPFSLPFAPAIVEAGTLAAAFAERRALAPLMECQRTPTRLTRSFGPEGHMRLASPQPVAADAEPSVELGFKVKQTVKRRDAVLSRARWQFVERGEVEGYLGQGGDA